jgi:spermidine synthase
LSLIASPRNKALPKARAAAMALPNVTLSEDGETRYLHLDSIWVQGSMTIAQPFDIHLDYVQRMMAWLLFAPDVSLTALGAMHAMQLGLGSAAATKFCYKRLKMRTTAVELNPQVVAACRQWFKLPADDARLSVVLADAAREVREDAHARTVDALQIDLYDHEAAGPVLDGFEFYSDCRDLLTEDGALTVNLFGRNASFAASTQALADVFGPQAVWVFSPTREGNAVVLALCNATQPTRAALGLRAAEIERCFKLPAKKWLRILKPYQALA